MYIFICVLICHNQRIITSYCKQISYMYMTLIGVHSTMHYISAIRTRQVHSIRHLIRLNESDDT